MLKNNTIRTFNNAIISSNDFINRVKELNEEGLDIYIGTDSQVIKEKISIVTCVCFYKKGIKKNQIFWIFAENSRISLNLRLATNLSIQKFHYTYHNLV